MSSSSKSQIDTQPGGASASAACHVVFVHGAAPPVEEKNFYLHMGLEFSCRYTVRFALGDFWFRSDGIVSGVVLVLLLRSLHEGLTSHRRYSDCNGGFLEQFSQPGWPRHIPAIRSRRVPSPTCRFAPWV